MNTNNIRRFPTHQVAFLEAVLDIDLPIEITAKEVDDLADAIVEAGVERGLHLKRSEVMTHLKDRFTFKVSTLDKLNQEVLDIQSAALLRPQVGLSGVKYRNRVRRNVRKYLRRRGKSATRKYLKSLAIEYPVYKHVYDQVLKELP